MRGADAPKVEEPMDELEIVSRKLLEEWLHGRVGDMDAKPLWDRLRTVLERRGWDDSQWAENEADK